LAQAILLEVVFGRPALQQVGCTVSPIQQHPFR